MLYKCPDENHPEIYQDPQFNHCPVPIAVLERKRAKGGTITIKQHCNKLLIKAEDISQKHRE